MPDESRPVLALDMKGTGAAASPKPGFPIPAVPWPPVLAPPAQEEKGKEKTGKIERTITKAAKKRFVTRILLLKKRIFTDKYLPRAMKHRIFHPLCYLIV